MIFGFCRFIFGLTTRTRKFVFFDCITGKTDSTKTYEDERQDDKDSEHVLGGHQENQTELYHIEEGVETVLDATNNTSFGFFNILLHYLGNGQVRDPKTKSGGDDSSQEDDD